MKRLAVFAAFVLFAAVAFAGDPSLTAVGVKAGTATGSGTVVLSDGTKSAVLTCRHVVEAGNGYAVVSGDKSWPADLSAVSPDADLALLVLDAKLPKADTAADCKVGSVVRQWGRPYGGKVTPKAGLMAGDEPFSTAGQLGGATSWWTTVACESGDSGAGLFDADDRLCGVCWGHARGAGVPELAVRLADVLKFLKDEKDALATPKPLKWHSDYDAFKKEVDATGKPALLLFTSPENCIYCRKLEAGALASPAVKKELAKFVLLKVDVSQPAGERLALSFGQAAWPAMMIYRDGKLTKQHQRDLPPAKMIEFLR